MSDKPLLLTLDDKDANSALESKLRANAFADVILSKPAGTPDRWRAIFQVWYGLDPNAKEDHVAACIEAARIRSTIDDKDYGLTKASRGLAHGEEVNGQIRNSLVAVMPEKLKAWLVRFDPMALSKSVNTGAKEQRKIWRKVYATFPMYRTTLKQGDW
jgi:hypothetical protein